MRYMSSGDDSIHAMVCVSVENACVSVLEYHKLHLSQNKIVRWKKRFSVITSMDLPLATITPWYTYFPAWVSNLTQKVSLQPIGWSPREFLQSTQTNHSPVGTQKQNHTNVFKRSIKHASPKLCSEHNRWFQGPKLRRKAVPLLYPPECERLVVPLCVGSRDITFLVIMPVF